jgi:hypothetical protein
MTGRRRKRADLPRSGPVRWAVGLLRDRLHGLGQPLLGGAGSLA